MDKVLSRNGAGPKISSELPPHDREAEEALLGAILINEGIPYQVEDLNLTADDFYIIKLGWIFEAMVELHRSGRGIDLVTLSDKLEQQDRLKEVGDTAFIISLINATPSVSHATWYGQMIKDYAYRRRIIEASARIVQLAYDETIELGEVVSQSEDIWQSAERFYSPQDTWQIRSLADAYKPRPPLCYIVKDLIALPSLSVVFGAPGSKKSLIIADMLACIAGGKPWLPPLGGQTIKPRETMQAPVFWLDFDNGRRRTDERIEAFARALELPESTGFHYVSFPDPWLQAADRAQMQALRRRIEKLGAKVVVFDNLTSISDSRNQNSSEMTPVMSNLRWLAEETGSAGIVIHHEKKNFSSKARPGEAIRGFGGIEGAVDLALQVKLNGKNEVVITSTKSRDCEVPPFAAHFTYEHKPGTTELAKARFFGVRPPKEQADPAEKLQATILACVKADPGLSQTKLRDKVMSLTGMGRDRVRDEILAMAEAGNITASTNGSGKAAAYYQGEQGEIDF